MTVRDVKAQLALAEAVGPQDVRDYLRSRGWSVVKSRRDYAAIYRSASEPATEVVVPLDRSLGDYADAIMLVAQRIATHEGRASTGVLHDLRRPRVDVLRFALEGTETRGGTVGLLSGLSLVDGVRKALLASACSIASPGRKFYPRMSHAEAESFVQRCHLGQTEVGSFVVNVETPLEPNAQLTTSDDPFGRRATTYLLRALALLQRSISAGDPKLVLEPDASDPVVTKNLCDAVVAMAAKDEGLDLRVDASFSPLVNAPKMATSVYFERSAYQVIEELGQRLRPSGGPRPAQFVGFVSRLSGEPADAGIEGEVELTVQVDEEEVLPVRVALDAIDYRKAGEAHLDQRYVKLRGTLHRGARLHRLADISDFTVLDA